MSHLDDKESDEEVPGRGPTTSWPHAGRGGITLAMLLEAGYMQAGHNVLTIDYLGNNFQADLESDGTIRSDGHQYHSPSAWAIHCKKLVNPDKKSGCGWASVKYKGRKLDAYKTMWHIQHGQSRPRADSESNSTSPAHTYNDTGSSETEHTEADLHCVPSDINKKQHQRQQEDDNSSHKYIHQDAPLNLSIPTDSTRYYTNTSDHAQNLQKKSVKHGTLGKQSSEHKMSTQVETIPFSVLGRIQPFTIIVSTNCQLLMETHCHLSRNEVVGYLAGKWDFATQQLSITQAYPCLCGTEDNSVIPQIEAQIRQSIENDSLTLVGWYHSHPFGSADPSLRDINLQMSSQLRLRGPSNSYIPCVAIINAPYGNENATQKQQAFWVMPPPENKPNDYGMPMYMSMDSAQDYYISQELMGQLKHCLEYYRSLPDLLPFSDVRTPYMKQLKRVIKKNLPAEADSTPLLNFIQDILCSPESFIS